MSLIPAWEIGVWNAWIFMIIIFLCIILTVRIFKGVGEKMSHGGEEKKYAKYVALFFFILLIYSIFLPLKLWLMWFYIGLILYVLGLIVLTITVANIATTPEGEPFTKGVYRYSRNALSLGMILVFIGIGIASASWLFLLIVAVLTVITHFMILVEERTCLNKFGKAYRDYTKRTPRWLGIPKAENK
jgi:protein-S-isoprenylcysteine O-methyltransferase Ste14